MTIQLEIGKSYINREGEKVKIVGIRAATAYRYQSERGSWYAEDGRFNSVEPECGFDLVEECEADDVATEVVKLPLCEAICGEIGEDIQASTFTEGMAMSQAQAIIRKHFAALSVEEVAMVIHTNDDLGDRIPWGAMSPIGEKQRQNYRRLAQAVLRLLRKE